MKTTDVEFMSKSQIVTKKSCIHIMEWVQKKDSVSAAGGRPRGEGLPQDFWSQDAGAQLGFGVFLVWF